MMRELTNDERVDIDKDTLLFKNLSKRTYAYQDDA